MNEPHFFSEDPFIHDRFPATSWEIKLMLWMCWRKCHKVNAPNAVFRVTDEKIPCAMILWLSLISHRDPAVQCIE